MDELISLIDPKILTIPIIECGEQLVDIKNRVELSYGPPPESPKTKNDYTKMREGVYKRLCAAQAELPHGWRFRIYEGYRSIDVQKMLFNEESNRILNNDPTKSPELVFNEAIKVISPVLNFDGSPNLPVHNTGGAVDIEVIAKDGSLVDMGMEIKNWTCLNHDLFYTDCSSISKKAQQNRRLLLDLMTTHGFVNLPFEWWHFSYGDRYWAFRQGENCALYGSADNIPAILG